MTSIVIFILLFLIIIILFVVINFFIKKNNENFNNKNIIFLTDEQTKNLLLSNEDGYYDEFSQADFFARGIKNIEEYLEKIKSCCSNFTDSEKGKIINAIKNVDSFFSNKCKVDWINSEKLISIPWKFGITKDLSYDNGLPHTRLDTILFCSERLKSKSEKDLEALLVHEKIHIYQKNFPEECCKYNDIMGFIKVRKINKNDLIRANPDTDHYLYKNRLNQYLIGKYNSDTPENLLDTSYSPFNEQSYEHPYEHMAIKVERLYKNNV